MNIDVPASIGAPPLDTQLHMCSLVRTSLQVDTHVHASSCMNQKHLLRFIKKKMRDSAQEVVINSKGVKLTLSQVSKRRVQSFHSRFCLVRGMIN